MIEYFDYLAQIDGGIGGEIGIAAENSADALALAVRWARTGVWPKDGCTIEVSVVSETNPADRASETVHIAPTDREKRDEDTIPFKTSAWIVWI